MRRKVSRFFTTKRLLGTVDVNIEREFQANNHQIKMQWHGFHRKN